MKFVVTVWLKISMIQLIFHTIIRMMRRIGQIYYKQILQIKLDSRSPFSVLRSPFSSLEVTCFQLGKPPDRASKRRWPLNDQGTAQLGELLVHYNHERHATLYLAGWNSHKLHVCSNAALKSTSLWHMFHARFHWNTE